MMRIPQFSEARSNFAFPMRLASAPGTALHARQTASFLSASVSSTRSPMAMDQPRPDMARIALGTWMMRYPLGGNLSWSIQWLVGFQRLGHDVYLLEKSGYPNSCFDPEQGVMSDDCSYGINTVNALLSRFGLQDRWCFVDS